MEEVKKLHKEAKYKEAAVRRATLTTFSFLLDEDAQQELETLKDQAAEDDVQIIGHTLPRGKDKSSSSSSSA